MAKTNLIISKEEMKNIENLEEELLAQGTLEINIGKEVKKRVAKYAGLSKLYSDPKKIQELIDELKSISKELIASERIKGAILSRNDIMKFIERSKKRDFTDRISREIKDMSSATAKIRMNVMISEIEKHGKVLKTDIEIFFKNAQINRLTDKQIIEKLAKLGTDQEGITANFAKMVERSTIEAVRREKEMARQDGYLEQGFTESDLWQWITISEVPCPDCQERAGKVLAYTKWLDMGLPGFADTICGRKCRCELKPEEISAKEFPTVKMFDLDRKNLVLTTKSQERTLNSKKAQPDNI